MELCFHFLSASAPSRFIAWDVVVPGVRANAFITNVLPEICHSEERSDEESLKWSLARPSPQGFFASLRSAQNDRFARRNKFVCPIKEIRHLTLDV